MSMLSQLGQLSIDTQVLSERLSNLKSDLAGKHAQNRKDIHEMRNQMQSLSNQIWLLKLKVAGYSGLGSGAVVGVVEVVKYLIQNHKG